MPNDEANQPPTTAPTGTPPTRRSTSTPDVLTGRQIGVTSGVGALLLVLLIGATVPLADPVTSSDWFDVVRSAVLALGALGALSGGYIAYRRQRTLEQQRDRERASHELASQVEANRTAEQLLERDRLANEADISAKKDLRSRYAEAATQLGGSSPAVKLAGIFAMTNLVSDWPDPTQRQACIDVLSAVAVHELNTPSTAPTSGPHLSATLLQAITRQLQPSPDGSNSPHWTGLRFDFGGAEFAAGTWAFDGSTLAGCRVLLTGIVLNAGAHLTFYGCHMSTTDVVFDRSTFKPGSRVSFAGAEMSSSSLTFDNCTLHVDAVISLNPLTADPDSSVTVDGGQIAGSIVVDPTIGGRCSRDGHPFAGHP